MLEALRPGRRGAGRDEVVDRQTPGLEPGTAESEGLGAGCGSAASDTSCVGWEWGRVGRFHGNGVIQGGDKQGHSQHFPEGSLRPQPVCRREIEDLRTGTRKC